MPEFRYTVLVILFSLPTIYSICQNVISINLTDSLSGEPVIGAIIKCTLTSEGAISDANGIFSVPASWKLPENALTIQHNEYTVKKIDLSLLPDSGIFNIQLLPIDHELEEVTVYSERTNSRIADLPVKVEVIGNDETSEENLIKPANILSLLGDIAGIQLQQLSALSGNMLPRIQGLNGRYTLFLSNGIPQLGGIVPGINLLQIPPLDLKQIEIIKGCHSALYGQDALGGVINFISKEPTEKKEWSATLNHTSLKETNLNSFFSAKNKLAGITLFAGISHSKAIDVDGDGFSDVPQSTSVNIHPILYFYFGQIGRLTLGYQFNRDQRNGGDIISFSKNAPDSLYNLGLSSLRHAVNLSWNINLKKNLDFQLKSGASFNKQIVKQTLYKFPGTENNIFTECSLHKITGSMNWILGVTFQELNFLPADKRLYNATAYKTLTTGVFIQNNWKINKILSTQLAFREDYVNPYGSFQMPHFSILATSSSHSTFRFNAGMAYKIPYYLRYIDPESQLQDFTKTDINPEKATGVNIDYTFKLKTGALNITINQEIFLTQIRRPVIEYPIHARTFQLINADNSFISKGFQTYLRLRWPGLEVFTSYVLTIPSYHDSRIASIPAVTPRHTISSTLFKSVYKGLETGIESSLIAGQRDSNGQPVRTYMLLAAMIRYETGRYVFVLNGENLFDIRQTKYGSIYNGDRIHPVFKPLWAPVDGRVFNAAIKFRIF
ncbi:MAG: TonB-dependent receptor plug domain-containing protein [Saprospiraceae bacterium]